MLLYVLDFEPKEDDDWRERKENFPATHDYFVVAGLQHGKEFQFRVAAENRAGRGPWSSASVTTYIQMKSLYLYLIRSKTLC